MFNENDASYSVRPVIEVDGEVQERLSQSLLSLTITEAVTEMARLQARFVNWGMSGHDTTGFEFFDGGLLAFGKEVGVSFDGGGGSVKLFQGRITAIEGLYPKNSSPEIQVYAEDGLEALRHTRRSRVFYDVNDEDVFDTIASEYGLQPDLQDIPNREQKVIAQLDQTDLAFLLGRARRLGLDLWMDGNTLYVQGRTSAEQARELALGESLIAFRVRADLAEQVTELGVTGWNVEEKEALDAIADARLIPVQVFGSQTGSTLIDQTYGGRTERLVRQVPLDRAEAQALADAQFLARAYRFVIGDGEAEGRPDLRAGKTVLLGGLGPWFDGVYHLVAVRHSFDRETGYRTTFSVERPALGEASGSSYGRTRRRSTKPQRRGQKILSRRGKKPEAGKEAKTPRQEREPKPEVQKDTRLINTTVHTVLDHETLPPEKLDDPAVTRPSKGITDEGD